MDVTLELCEDRALIAVQGPEAAQIVQSVSSLDMTKLAFMTSKVTEVAGVSDCRITRCGYTGEDGVEISIPQDRVTEVMQALLASEAGQAKLAGLGARDSLRLEAGLCLYGNDIDETTSPVEAGLTWTIGKRRRQAADFPGAKIILEHIRAKPARKRVGIVSKGPPAREGTPIMQGGQEIGKVTSGCPSPSLGVNVAMGYVPASAAKSGTELGLSVRGKSVGCHVTKMPFVPTNYYS